MRGISLTSPLPAARAFLAGAALLAGAATAPVHAQGTRSQDGDTAPNETAMAIPRVSPEGAAGVVLPEPLAPSEAARIRRIFALQARNRMDEASDETERLRDTTLLGHILADRYLRQGRNARTEDLLAWLRRRDDAPDAPRVRALLAQDLPRGAKLPPLPPVAASAAPAADEDAGGGLPRRPWLDRAVRARIASGKPGNAAALIDRTRHLDPRYAALLKAEVARALFSDGRDEAASRLAREAMRQSENRVGLAGFVAGLAAWRVGRPAEAAEMFAKAWKAELAPAGLRAASAYWAGRAELRAGHVSAYMPWMRRAARRNRSFYGLLARERIGLGPGIGGPGDHEVLGEADVDAVDATPEGHRAFALLQIGEAQRAEDELRALCPAARNNPGLGRSIMLVATRAGMTDLASELAARLQAADGRPRDDLRFPLPPLHPRGGFLVNPAMVYGLTLLESHFDPHAVSSAGATGLMQLTPAAAQMAAGGRSSAGRLRDPALNLELGQRYLLQLARLDTVADDLIRLLASYNAGPGATAKWGEAEDGDPLAFIEAIPIEETRHYVKRALLNTWIYAARLHLAAPSLDELADDSWPRFSPLAERATLRLGPDGAVLKAAAAHVREASRLH